MKLNDDLKEKLPWQRNIGQTTILNKNEGRTAIPKKMSIWPEEMSTIPQGDVAEENEGQMTPQQKISPKTAMNQAK